MRPLNNDNASMLFRGRHRRPAPYKSPKETCQQRRVVASSRPGASLFFAVHGAKLVIELKHAPAWQELFLERVQSLAQLKGFLKIHYRAGQGEDRQPAPVLTGVRSCTGSIRCVVENAWWPVLIVVIAPSPTQQRSTGRPPAALLSKARSDEQHSSCSC